MRSVFSCERPLYACGSLHNIPYLGTTTNVARCYFHNTLVSIARVLSLRILRLLPAEDLVQRKQTSDNLLGRSDFRTTPSNAKLPNNDRSFISVIALKPMSSAPLSTNDKGPSIRRLVTPEVVVKGVHRICRSAPMSGLDPRLKATLQRRKENTKEARTCHASTTMVFTSHWCGWGTLSIPNILRRLQDAYPSSTHFCPCSRNNV